MKRLFEYMIAENQTIDGGYLDHLTQHSSRKPPSIRRRR